MAATATATMANLTLRTGVDRRPREAPSPGPTRRFVGGVVTRIAEPP